MEYPAIILFAVIACGTPGPNNTMIMTSGLNYGIRRSLPHYFGIVLGFSAMVFAVGLGIASVFESIPALTIILKVLGILYLSYLAYKIASAPVELLSQSTGTPFTFLQAAAFQWVNPKAWALALSATLTYTIASVNYTFQVFVISIIFLIFGSPVIMLWLWFGSALKELLKKPKTVRIFNISMALLLILTLIPVFIELLADFGLLDS